MEKIKNFFGVKTILVSFIFASLFMLGNVGTLFGQTMPQKEICNGKDDNGDGQVDENVNCDHYLSYRLNKIIAPVGVALRDQFINATDFKLVSLERLLNPAKKMHNGMVFNPRRPDLHYLAYGLHTSVSFTPRSVIIENQFEKRTILATKPHYLLTPAGKKKIGIPFEEVLPHWPASVMNKLLAHIVPAIPQDANHYLCYDVEPYEMTENIVARDQFQEMPFKVIRARYLCNPVEKIHDGKISEVVDRDNHLMCYEVMPHNKVNRKALTHDQFGIKSLVATETEEICVPTVKTHIVEACVRPDDQGTAVLFDKDTQYMNTGGKITIIQPTAGNVGITADALLRSSPDTAIIRNGSPMAGEIYMFDTEMLALSLSGGRVVNIPVQGEIGSSPRTLGDSLQSFDTDMRRLQGQLPPGDPDFDLLRITAGSGFGLPSPGHTTMTRLSDGNWNVDSFFDITYRIDFIGAPAGPLAGMSGSQTGTVRIKGPCLDQ